MKQINKPGFSTPPPPPPGGFLPVAEVFAGMSENSVELQDFWFFDVQAAC